MKTIKFVPTERDCGLPALLAGPDPRGHGFVFQAIDSAGEPQVETKHATFADVLAQVTASMRTYWQTSTEWEVEEDGDPDLMKWRR